MEKKDIRGMDVFRAAGWSPKSLLSALSPESYSRKNQKNHEHILPGDTMENADPNIAFSRILKDAGWSPSGLLAALSPMSHNRHAPKRSENWCTPDSAYLCNPKKSVDMKMTPVIDLTFDDSPTEGNQQKTAIKATSDDIDSLSATLASQSIDPCLPNSKMINQTKTMKFQTAKRLFIDDLAITAVPSIGKSRDVADATPSPQSSLPPTRSSVLFVWY